MAYLPQAQQTPWQQSDDIDLAKTAVLVVAVLGGSEGAPPGLEVLAYNAIGLVRAARKRGARGLSQIRYAPGRLVLPFPKPK